MKTKYSSYCINNLPEGCRYCVKGEKLVLFISGICGRNCYYCSLSKKRKNKNVIYANERICRTTKDAINEAIESNATSAGITGGDPLLFISRTVKYAKALKNRFRKKFHIHIYLPTKHLNENKLKVLSKHIDEVRFHSEFLSKRLSEKEISSEIEKIKIAGKFWNRKNIGIELPVIPENKKEILDFIIRICPFIGFANLNELELSDTNFNIMTRKYTFNETGYVIKESKPAGIWILKQLERKKIPINIHFCTADLKNHYQYKNRLKKHKILRFGHRTEDGTVVYLAVKKSRLNKNIKKYFNSKNSFFDRQKKQFLISEQLAGKIIKENIIERIEEFPTFDRIEIEKEFL